MGNLEVVPVIGPRVGWRDFAENLKQSREPGMVFSTNEIRTPTKKYVFVDKYRKIQGLRFKEVVLAWGHDLLDDGPLIQSYIRSEIR